LSQITMRNAPRRPNPLDRPRIAPPPHRISLEAPPVNAICDTRESEEGTNIEEIEEESMDDYENYLEIEEVGMHNGLIECVDDEEEDDEEALSFSCVVFTRAQSKNGVSASAVAADDRKKKEDFSPKLPLNKIISRGSPLPPSMESSKEKSDSLVVKDHTAMP
ncbi:hypothetical protein KI387_043117, partial [Taxus chinensis]